MRTTTPSLLLLLLLQFPIVAHASNEGTPEKSAFQRLDDAFGKWFVGPLASVMFFDVWFWDNDLKPDDAIGVRMQDEEVTSYDPARGFSLEKVVRAEVGELQVILDTPATLRVGRVSVEVTGEAPPYTARVKQDLVDITGATQQPLSAWSGAPFVPEIAPLDAATPRVVVENIAPFPVLVELREGGAVAVPHEVPSGLVLPVVKIGDPVVYRGDRVTVRELDGGTAVVAGAVRYEATLVNPKGIGMPFIVLWLVVGAVFFTIRMAFINLRGFWHAVEVTRGKFDHEGDEGEISHFQALSSALSATVGLGNIAGVAVAVATGGPGAVFLMVVAGFLGMSS
ncbi:MAG: alanine:cation symporter family protein, partial [Myxococcota bacterium]